MLFANIILSITTFAALVLSLLILVSNSKKAVNRALASFLLGTFIWQLANLLTNLSKSPEVSLFFARTTLIGPCILAYSFLIFAKVYVEEKNFNAAQAVKLSIIPLVIIAFSPTKYNVSSIDSYGQNTVTGSIYIFLIPFVLLYFGWSLKLLFSRYRQTRNAIEREQIRYIFIGIILTLIPTLIANGILPALGHSSAVFYGPSAIIILAVFLSIAIIRHRLLDIKLIVARSITYILLLSTLVGVYGMVVFVVTVKLFGSSSYIANKVVPIIVAALLALSYRNLNKFFSRLTNRYFYQDVYEPQSFLDQLNKILVSTIEIDKMLEQVALEIDQNIKADYCLFLIHETTEKKSRFIGDNKNENSEERIRDLFEKLSPRRDKIITDELDDEEKPLQKLLSDNDIAMVVRLRGTSPNRQKNSDYIILGPKKSGNPFNKQDIRMIDIVANELVIAIQNALRFEEIKNFNITLQEKIDKATHELRKANERLKVLDGTKDDFISMASHQLRTPLTSVKGYISLVLEGDAGKITDNQRKLLTQAFTSSQRMVYLIADLLNVSRLKTGKFVIERTPTNLADVISDEVGQLKETAQARHLDLIYNKPNHFPIVDIDETKTRQVIMNFMDNAIYYTPAGGKIEVSLMDRPDSIEFTVKDNGIGVPKSEVHHLFSKFYRAGNARKARPDGTGLGLFMAKKVIVAQDGALIFHSQEGTGSTFGFSFAKKALK